MRVIVFLVQFEIDQLPAINYECPIFACGKLVCGIALCVLFFPADGAGFILS